MVLKVITIYNKDTDSMEEVLLEELQVFKVRLLSGATRVINHSATLFVATLIL